ncbi:hypothetical protein FHT32_001113 [Variovorax sp. SG517]|nr:hypothetical protein [Variovorax sp. SG517]
MNRDNPSMSQTDFFSERTTLYTPAWYSDKTREERELPLSPADYKVSPGDVDDRWTVTSLKDGTVVYSGIGPVEIRRT